MQKPISKFLLATIIAAILFQCKNDPIQNTLKLLPNDPFQKTITPSQSFEIDGKQDQVLEGKNGTVVVCPKGCFTKANGDIVEGMVQVELSEALTLDEMLLSNLTTTSNGKQLETGGMIYFNATANGEQLLINKDIPVHIEIPTVEKKAGMMAYTGVRDANGNMNWIEPKELTHDLITVDINTLDFLPPGFQAAVNKGMPYKNHKMADQALTDSLYYSLSVSDGSRLTAGFVSTNLNEAYYNKGKQVVNGNYTTGSYQENGGDFAQAETNTDSLKTNCGIDPARIKVIKSEKYQNTFIATREFEERLKVIFKTCNNAVLETYINNLDKNLYEADSLAAQVLGANAYRGDFINFSRQHLTKVKQADKYAALLKGYYETQLAKVKSELEASQEKLTQALQKENEATQKLTDDYKQLLWKREKYRMETYGFDWTETGWVNIDNGTLPKDWSSQPLEIFVSNGKQFDRVYTYVIYTSIKSLYRLNGNDYEHFYAGSSSDNSMLMPNKKEGIAIAIGYKGDAVFLALQGFETATEPKLSLTLSPSSIEQVKAATRSYDDYASENNIGTDIEFMTKFYKEEQRQKQLLKESEFILQLWNIAFPCCNEQLSGEQLFKLNCTSCHYADDRPLTGSGLAYSTSKYSKDWLYRWTTNSGEMIRNGDPIAVRIFREGNSSVQPDFPALSRKDVAAIFDYVDAYNAGGFK